jgi:hypothetical protein
MEILKLHSYGAAHQNDSVRKPALRHAAPLWLFHAEIGICGIEADLIIKATNFKNFLRHSRKHHLVPIQ